MATQGLDHFLFGSDPYHINNDVVDVLGYLTTLSDR